MVAQTILPRLKVPKSKDLIKRKGAGYRISSVLRSVGFQKIQDKAKELNLDTKSPKITIIGKNDTECGNDKAKESSIDRYATAWRGLLDFCIEFEDWRSGIILHRAECPADPFPVAEDLAIHYMRFHVLEKGSVLKHYKTDQPILKDGSPVLCRGDWMSAATIGIYRSALTKLHLAYASTQGPYVQRCPKCIQIPLEQACNGRGCTSHPGNPHYWSRGCLTASEEFKKHVLILVDYAICHYEVRSTIAFLPSEIRDIRKFLLLSNRIECLMLWVMIIVGIKEFLRIDEVLELTYEQFLTKYFVVKPGYVESLLVKIKGKRDRNWQNFAIWHDEDCPEFSPVVALLIWIAATGIKGGRLFPSLAQLEAKVDVPTENYSYDSVLEDFKYLCGVVLGKDLSSPEGKKLIAGTHMLRKTAFLVAYWGKSNHPNWRGQLEAMDEASILLDARHKDTCSTMTYLGDSATLKALLDRINANDVTQKVGRYNPIYVKTVDSFAALSRSNGDLSHKLNDKNLSELADWYVFFILRIDPENFRNHAFSIAQIFDCAMQYKPDLTVQQKYETILKEKLDEEDYAEVMSSIQETQDQRVMTLVNHLQSITSKPSIPEVAKKNETAKSTKKNIVEFSRNFRVESNKAQSKADKVGLLVAAAKEVEKQVREGKLLVDPLKSWAYRAGKIAQCVFECHDGNVAQFVSQTPGFRLGKWKCCNGVKHKACFYRSKLA
jgi:hypothetical protein